VSDLLNLESFLRLGYFLEFPDASMAIDTSGADKSRYASVGLSELVEIGTRRLLEAVERQFVAHDDHLVLLSGGLDSRAILAALLRFTEAKNCATCTFGTPGTHDFDIGNMIARRLGTRHVSLPLTSHRFALDDLLDASRRSGRQTLLFYQAPLQELDRRFGGCRCWSGFMGDPSTGSHLPEHPARDLTSAKNSFIRRNTFVRSMRLTRCTDLDLFPLIDGGTETHLGQPLTLEEQLDFRNRQVKYTAPHVLAHGFRYATPFLDPDWLGFILSVNDALRYDQRLYKRILLRAFPELFALPTKTHDGYGLDVSPWRRALGTLGYRTTCKLARIVGPWRPGRHLNYLDFDEELRHRRDLQEIVSGCLADLRRRGIVDWVDSRCVWERHMDRRGNHADALLVLASLEIHLKAGRTP
jgi:hypothetical protein